MNFLLSLIGWALGCRVLVVGLQLLPTEVVIVKKQKLFSEHCFVYL